MPKTRRRLSQNRRHAVALLVVFAWGAPSARADDSAAPADCAEARAHWQRSLALQAEILAEYRLQQEKLLAQIQDLLAQQQHYLEKLEAHAAQQQANDRQLQALQAELAARRGQSALCAPCPPAERKGPAPARAGPGVSPSQPQDGGFPER